MLKDFNSPGKTSVEKTFVENTSAEPEFELDIPETLASPESLAIPNTTRPATKELPLAESADHSAYPKKADPEYFRNLTVEWLDAWKTRNVDYLNEHVSDEFCFISRRVRNMSVDKATWRRMVTEQYTLQKYEIEFVTINVHEFAAVVVYQLTMMLQPSFSNLPEKFIVTDTWTLSGGEWKTMSRQPLPV